MAPFHQLFTLLSGGEHVKPALSRKTGGRVGKTAKSKKAGVAEMTCADILNLSCQRCLETPRFDGADAGLVATGWKTIRRLMLKERCQCR